MAVSDRLVWIDCEMTGLDLSADALVEVAVLVTDAQLQVLGDGVDVVATGAVVLHMRGEGGEILAAPRSLSFFQRHSRHCARRAGALGPAVGKLAEVGGPLGSRTAAGRFAIGLCRPACPIANCVGRCANYLANCQSRRPVAGG